MTNITTFFILPTTVTTQEKIGFEDKICKTSVINIKDQNGDLTDPGTTGHSVFIEHPSNGTCIYAINGAYANLMLSLASDEERDEYKPIANFASAIDNKDYSISEIKALGFFPQVDIDQI